MIPRMKTKGKKIKVNNDTYKEGWRNYAHVYIDDSDEPSIAVGEDGSIRDFDKEEWIVEPGDKE